MSLPATDLVVLLGFMAAMVAFGMWMGRHQRTGEDFMAAGRNLPWWALLGSIVATETSTVTFLSVPGIAYGGDLTLLQLPMGYLVGRVLVATVLLPLYFQGRFLTAYEVLQSRFGPSVRRTASVLFAITRTLADGLRLYLTALVLAKLTPFGIGWSVVLIGGATAVYTFFGGMRAVVWTDCIQFLIYMIGAALAFVLILEHLPDGWSSVMAVAAPGDKTRVFDFAVDFANRDWFWTGLIGGAFLTFGTHGVDQIIVQRYLCARCMGDARKALIGSGVVVLLQFAFFLLLGLALFAFFEGRTFAKGDDVFATFITESLPTPLMGIVLGAVFAAAMSTLSSSINSSATAITTDLVLPLRRLPADHDSALATVRLLTIVFCGLQILVGISGLGGGSVVNDVLTIAGITTGALLGLFILGLGNRRVPQAAGLAGLGAGVGLVLLLHFGKDFHGIHIAWPWYSLIGSTTTYAVGKVTEALLP